jgi:hypothetical protein
MDHEETIRRYYLAFKEADRKTLREITTADLAHVSEFGIYNDRDAMLDEIWPGVGKSWAEDLQIFGSYPEFMVRYSVVGGELPPRNMAEHIHFEGGCIAAIEVFIGREEEE